MLIHVKKNLKYTIWDENMPIKTSMNRQNKFKKQNGYIVVGGLAVQLPVKFI